MANVPESAAWEPGVYQLEMSDPVLGGAEGIDNLQAKQLANRTAYLKEEVEALALLIEGVSGGTTNHAALSNRSIADQHPMEAVTGLMAALAAKAEGAHTHSAAAITAGVMAEARLPAASSAARGIVQLVDDLQSLNTDRALTAAQGRALRLMIEQMSGGGTTDHSALINRSVADSHPMAAISGLADALAAKAAGTHVHAASAVTSGVFDAARLPAGTADVHGAVRLVDALNSAATDRALTARQGQVLLGLIDDLQTTPPVAWFGTDAGYLQVPTAAGNVLIQWRRANVYSGSLLSWPIAFPASCVAAFISERGMTDESYVAVGLRNVSTTGVVVVALNTSALSVWPYPFAPCVLGIGR